VTTAGDDRLRVADVPERQRYEGRIGDDVVGFVEYRSVRGRRILFHTEIDPAFEGRGIGSRLVAGVLDDIRAAGLRITVKCPFVTAYLERHRDQRDVLAAPPDVGAGGGRSA
jgi:predicted GNAT family acetyltransferase